MMETRRFLATVIPVCCALAAAAFSFPVSLSVNPGSPKLESKDDGGSKTTISQSCTYTGSISWHGATPTNATFEIYFIGHKIVEEGNSTERVLDSKKDQYTLTAGEPVKLEFVSPKVSSVKTKTTTRDRNRGRSRYRRDSGSSTKITRSGDRYDGIVARVIIDGQIARTFVQQPRWTVAAKKDIFSLDDAGGAASAATPVGKVNKKLGK